MPIPRGRPERRKTLFRSRAATSATSTGTLICVRPRRTAAIGFAVTLALAACGGSDEPTLDAGAGDATPAPAESGPDAATEAAQPPVGPSSGLTIADIDVPDVEVMSVPSGEAVNVAEIALGQDTLFWFYAPH